MASYNRIASWLLHDEKRKGTPQRKKTERARSKVRRSDLAKSGRCSDCKKKKPTVWHHDDYRKPLDVIELCHKCHRARHPRRIPSSNRLC